MFIARATCLWFLLFLICATVCNAQERVVQSFTPGPPKVKTVAEIKLLQGMKKVQETAQLTRNSNTPPTKEVYDLIDESLEIALAHDQKDQYAYLLCGKASLKLQQADTIAALALLKQAENTIPEIKVERLASSIYNALAIGYLRSGNASKAIEINQFLLGNTPDLPENRMRRLFQYRNLSNAYLKAQKKKEAIAALQTAVEMSSLTNNQSLIDDTNLSMAVLYASTDNEEKSFEILKTLLPKLNSLPTSTIGIVYSTLANSYQKAGDFQKANEYYKKLLEVEDKKMHVHALTRLMINAFRTNEKDSLESYYTRLQNKSLKYQQANAEYYYALSRYYDAKNNQSKTISFLKKAVTSKAGYQRPIEPLIMLADAYSKAGKKDSAELYFINLKSKLNDIRRIPSTNELYIDAVKHHQQRFKGSDSLVAVLNHQISLKNNEQQTKLFTITKDLESRYQVVEKEQQLKILSQQRKLDQLQIKQQQQQFFIIGLILLTVIIIATALIIVTNSKKKQAIQLHTAEVEALQNKHQVELLRTLDKAQEKERREIADKLHDEVGAMLSILKLNLSTATGFDNGNKTAPLSASMAIVDELSGQIRNLSHTLMPVVVEKYGMIRGVKDFVDKINAASKLKTELLITGFENENSLSVDVQMHIYRIVQELMNNIIKHSGATNALIQMVEHDGFVSLIVEDNGNGFNENENKGNGLYVLRSKVELMKGEMNIESTSGAGTSFMIALPKHIKAPLLYETNKIDAGG
jgi:two-component system NarL family sensor kinase